MVMEVPDLAKPKRGSQIGILSSDGAVNGGMDVYIYLGGLFKWQELKAASSYVANIKKF